MHREQYDLAIQESLSPNEVQDYNSRDPRHYSASGAVHADHCKAMTQFLIHQSQGLRVLAATAHVTWEVIRRPLFVVLALLEPVIRFVCILAMLSGIIAAIVFELSAVGPSFPILGMLSASLGFGFALIAYYGLFSLVSR